MEYSFNHQGDAYQLTLSGNFTFSDNAKFRGILATLRDAQASSLTLDMAQLEFIDSAALGMLLLLHDEASRSGFSVHMENVTGQIKKMLQLSNFDEIFSIRYA